MCKYTIPIYHRQNLTILHHTNITDEVQDRQSQSSVILQQNGKQDKTTDLENKL